MGVGVIGAGMISDAYLENIARFPDLDLVAIGTRDRTRARSQAERWGIPAWGDADSVLDHPDVELVLNLTVPSAHVEIGRAAVAAGKHVWNEKPIGTDLASVRSLLDDASDAGVRVGCAPDTMLGSGQQSARRAILRGEIGRPLSAVTAMQYGGPEIFHPDPEFYFAAGGGPLLDMGPYYLSALVGLLGPIEAVTAAESRAHATRTVLEGPRAGTEFAVEVATHVNAICYFAGDVVAQNLFSFDSPLGRSGVIEVTGTEGTMMVPDPNAFAGTPRITRRPRLSALGNEPVWETVERVGVDGGRGLGVLDMARAIREGRPHLTDGELGYHVLDVMLAMGRASAERRVVDIASSVDPTPLLSDFADPFAATL